jgi:hypothetical protein
MDLQERAHQVSMMAETYFCAYANLIHLGDDDEKAESTFDSIERIVREIEDEAGGVNPDDFIFYDNQLVKRSTSPLTCGPDFDALTWLFNRPWFRFGSPIAELTYKLTFKGQSPLGSPRAASFKSQHSILWETVHSHEQNSHSSWVASIQTPTFTTLDQLRRLLGGIQHVHDAKLRT